VKFYAVAADAPGNNHPPTGTDLVMKGREAMSSIDPSTSAPRSRGRLAAWLAFGAVGLATGAVWASGFGSATAANGTTVVSPALAKTPPVAATNALGGTVTKINDLTFDWQGRWAKIAADTTMFEVDLSALPGGNTYNLALLVANTTVLTGWASTQLEVERVDVAAGGDCSAATYAHSGPHADLLHFNDQDGGVYWTGVAGHAVYCIGVSNTSGDVSDGTFLRGAQDAPPTGFPVFIATVDRAS
jgi:hypothetical protein